MVKEMVKASTAGQGLNRWSINFLEVCKTKDMFNGYPHVYNFCAILKQHGSRNSTNHLKMSMFFADTCVKIHSTTRDKISLKCKSILEEYMIEKCTLSVDDMAQHLGPDS